MATLENTSKELGSNNLRYSMVHGEADIKHADQFTWALTHEMELHEDGERILQEAITATVEFLKKMFETI